MLSLFMVLAFLASMAGGLLPAAEGLLERLGLDRVVSFRSGLLIAVALGEALPEAWGESRAATALSAFSALALGWFLHRGHAHEHAGHELTHPHIEENVDQTAAVAALFVHSLIDGLNLGAIALVGGPALLAVGTASSLHKMADGFTLTNLFHQTERPHGRVLTLLVAVSLMTPLGAVLGRESALRLGPITSGILLGFAGGSFLYVGAAQIVPHLTHRKDVRSAVSFVVGLGAMFALIASSSAP